MHEYGLLRKPSEVPRVAPTVLAVTVAALFNVIESPQGLGLVVQLTCTARNTGYVHQRDGHKDGVWHRFWYAGKTSGAGKALSLLQNALGCFVAGVFSSEASVGQPAHTPSDMCQRASVAGAQQEAGDGRQQQEDGPALLEAECWVRARLTIPCVLSLCL